MCNCEVKDYCCEHGCCGTHDIFAGVNLAANYQLYCEAKKEINEEPLSYDDWLVLEKDAHHEYGSV